MWMELYEGELSKENFALEKLPEFLYEYLFFIVTLFCRLCF